MAQRDFPFSTYKTYLYKGATKLIDIKDFTEPISPREQLDTTTIISDARTYRPGIRETKSVQFTCNYLKGGEVVPGKPKGFEDLKALEGTEYTFSIRFGDNGEDGIFTFNAYLSVNVKSGGVNEVTEMVITLSPTSEVVFS